MAARVRYARTVNLGNYENERLEIEDDTFDDESINEAYQRVKGWVESTLQDRDTVREKEEHLIHLEGKIKQATLHMNRIHERHRNMILRYRELQTILKQHGVDLNDLPDYLLPEPRSEEEGASLNLNWQDVAME
ncbi:MAG: hypothetical protein EOM24_00780 [Chloroflexia bacterium]|nr:hypothetical protein [Chloroflexia bacterium]